MYAVTTTIVLPPETITFDPQVVTVEIDLDDIRILLAICGCPADKIDLAQAVCQAESGGYSDAVGDLDLVGPKWGPSIGLFQMRSLRHPPSFGGADSMRWAYPLLEPTYNVKAMLQVTSGAQDFSKWSVFSSKSYEQYLGQNPRVRTGHTHAGEWWK